MSWWGILLIHTRHHLTIGIVSSCVVVVTPHSWGDVCVLSRHMCRCVHCTTCCVCVIITRVSLDIRTTTKWIYGNTRYTIGVHSSYTDLFDMWFVIVNGAICKCMEYMLNALSVLSNMTSVMCTKDVVEGFLERILISFCCLFFAWFVFNLLLANLHTQSATMDSTIYNEALVNCTAHTHTQTLSQTRKTTYTITQPLSANNVKHF